MMFATDTEKQHSKVIKSPDKVVPEKWKTPEKGGRNVRREDALA